MSKRAAFRERRRRERRRRNLIMLSIVAGIALVVAALLILPNLRPVGDVVVPDSNPRPMADGTAMGDPNAPVRIDEYSDFQCPYCRRFHEQTLDRIAEEYVATGKVYFVYHNFPFIGQESLDAASASMCAAEQGRFWEYADVLFANQTGENVGAFSRRRLEAFAAAIGLDVEAFNKCLSEDRYKQQVQEDYLSGINSQVQSTPSFLVNGKLLTGALPFPDFQAEIEAALAASGS